MWTSTHLNFTFKTSYSASILPSIVMSVKWDFEYQCWQCHNVTHNLHNERIVQQLLSDITDNEYDSKRTMFVCLFVCLFVCFFVPCSVFVRMFYLLCTYVHTYGAFHPPIFVLLFQNISSAFPNAAVIPLYNHASNLLGALEAAYKVRAWRWPFCSIHN